MTVPPPRWLVHRRILVQSLIALVLGAALACSSRLTEPTITKPGPPYLAILTAATGTRAIVDSLKLSYAIKELSGTYKIDTTLTRSPRDTAILSVPAATYSVKISGVPPQCDVRQGAEAIVVISPQENTGIARYSISCQASLEFAVLTTGVQTDSVYVWDLSVAGSGTAVRTGTVGANATVTVDAVPAGTYDLSLRNLKSSCLIISNGGATQRLVVPPGGGATTSFYVRCSDGDDQPHIRSFIPTYRNGAAAFIASAVDAGRNMHSYVFDLTDCAGTSVLPGGSRARPGLDGDRTARADSITILGVFDLGIADSVFAGRCASLRIEDTFGNTSLIAERPLNVVSGSGPSAISFNAVLNGPFVLGSLLTVADPDNDYIGAFVSVRLPDGKLGGIPDGRDDIGIYNVQGYLGTVIPDLPLTGRILFGDLRAVIVYLIDARGNVTRVEDDDVFR